MSPFAEKIGSIRIATIEACILMHVASGAGSDQPCLSWACVERISSAVESQDRQASVMEIP